MMTTFTKGRGCGWPPSLEMMLPLMVPFCASALIWANAPSVIGKRTTLKIRCMLGREQDRFPAAKTAQARVCHPAVRHRAWRMA